MAPLITVPHALRERLGEEGATALVELLNQLQSDWKNDVLTFVGEKFERRLAEEIGQLRTEIAQEFARLREEIARLREEMAQNDAALREEMARNDAALREEMVQSIAALREEMARNDAALREEMARIEARLGDRIARTEATLRVEIEQMRLDLERKFTIYFLVLLFAIVVMNQNALQFIAKLLGLVK